ncbi:MAG: hypothetical protein HYR63_26800 [Proteobacteria bacterium]|nr:hypothetical protein [Pseudomonadota bacterium]MBI3498834.1 hypothetical protein [Pseudomonadota bacterium]
MSEHDDERKRLGGGKTTAAGARRGREADALRTNLSRRKQQLRAREALARLSARTRSKDET